VCTLTTVPGRGGSVRLGFNRDESRTRTAALAPQLRHIGGRAAILPTDPSSGGTWLAVNDAGLALAVLNGNPPEQPRGGPKPARSRGALIPALLGCDSPAAVLHACERLTYPEYAPFRLVLVGAGVVADVRWDGREPMVMSRLAGGVPLMFTSSGLGDHLVEGVRRALFDELFASGPDTWPAAQAAFHRHRWPGREHLSVNMSRATARTVSHSVIDLGPTEAVFAYHADAPDRPAERTTLSLPLTAGVACPPCPSPFRTARPARCCSPPWCSPPSSPKT
jgi:hypothetical protein